MLKWRFALLEKSNMAAAPPDVTVESSATHTLDGSSKISEADDISDSSTVISAIKYLDFEWGDELVDQLVTFNDDDQLPCVAKFEEDTAQTDKLPTGIKIYQKQPLLFFKRVKKRQARARTIYHEKGGEYFEIGQTLHIPDDYTGWFELVPPDFRRASCFRSIEEVAKVMPRKFFTRSNLKAIRIDKGEDDEPKYLERKVKAGSFLRTDSVFTAKWKTSATTGVFKKKKTEWVTQEVKYLKCIDKDEKDILVPLSHRGKFNAIYEKGKLNQHSVYSMKDILSDLKLPVKVRLLFGKAPVVPCIFTGMLCIKEVHEDDVIIASTILNRRNVLLDLPVTSPVRVQLATREEDFTPLKSFEDAQKLCQKYAHMYSTLIKLSPKQDTDHKTFMYVPADPALSREENEALRALDLITDISLTDDEPVDIFMNESETDSVSVGSFRSDDAPVMPSGTIVELTQSTELDV